MYPCKGLESSEGCKVAQDTKAAGGKKRKRKIAAAAIGPAEGQASVTNLAVDGAAGTTLQAEGRLQGAAIAADAAEGSFCLTDEMFC